MALPPSLWKTKIRECFCQPRSGHNCLYQRIGNSLWLLHRPCHRPDTITQYVLDCGEFLLDATAETCKCHPGRRSFGCLLNYRPSNIQECNVRMKRTNIGGKDVVLFIAVRFACSSFAWRNFASITIIQLARYSVAGNVPIPLVPHGLHNPQEHLPVNLTEREGYLIKVLFIISRQKTFRFQIQLITYFQLYFNWYHVSTFFQLIKTHFSHRFFSDDIIFSSLDIDTYVSSGVSHIFRNVFRTSNEVKFLNYVTSYFFFLWAQCFFA